MQNKEKVEASLKDIDEMEILSGRLKELAEVFRMYKLDADSDESAG
jgi:hypothetical protein